MNFAYRFRNTWLPFGAKQMDLVSLVVFEYFCMYESFFGSKSFFLLRTIRVQVKMMLNLCSFFRNSSPNNVSFYLAQHLTKLGESGDFPEKHKFVMSDFRQTMGVFSKTIIFYWKIFIRTMRLKNAKK